MSNETRPDFDVIREYAKRRAAIGAVNGVYINDSVIELFDRIDRLTESNRRLANQIVGFSDRANDSIRPIRADAWDEGKKAGIAHLFGKDPAEPNNPYRSTSETI